MFWKEGCLKFFTVARKDELFNVLVIGPRQFVRYYQEPKAKNPNSKVQLRILRNIGLMILLCTLIISNTLPNKLLVCFALKM